MSDEQAQDVTTAPEIPQTLETPVSSQSSGSELPDLPPEAPESSQDVSAMVPVKDQNPVLNQPESDSPDLADEVSISEPIQPVPVQSSPSAPAPLTPSASQPQSPAQPDQTGFIRALLAKAQAKIQSNKQKKLDKIILFAQKKKIIANEDIQKLLHVSSDTATRYLVKLVQQGRLARVGNPRDAKYQFLR